MLPPDIKADWEENSMWQQAMLMAFGQIRDYEEMQMAAMSAGAKL